MGCQVPAVLGVSLCCLCYPPEVVLSPEGVGWWFWQPCEDATWAPAGLVWDGVGRCSPTVYPAVATLQGWLDRHAWALLVVSVENACKKRHVLHLESFF